MVPLGGAMAFNKKNSDSAPANSVPLVCVTTSSMRRRLRALRTRARWIQRAGIDIMRILALGPPPGLSAPSPGELCDALVQAPVQVHVQAEAPQDGYAGMLKSSGGDWHQLEKVDDDEFEGALKDSGEEGHQPEEQDEYEGKLKDSEYQHEEEKAEDVYEGTLNSGGDGHLQEAEDEYEGSLEDMLKNSGGDGHQHEEEEDDEYGMLENAAGKQTESEADAIFDGIISREV